ncbi:MAG: guanylate kinase [Lachnospiraceae bacterium]|nr:guanylate kinase [Lachnospiraceae bacterium]MDD6192432.1 guanylate kinase [Lachnospiraceae bacterium]MDY4794179.1 guanylate kinase [Pararoseburia sp.]
MDKKGLIIVLSGFSGAGKGTIMKHLLKKYPDAYHLSISATTRAPRQGEEDGREYFFRTQEEFDAMIANNELLEYATFNGNSYGTPRSYVEKLVEEGKDVILEIEIQGALQVKKMYPEAVLLFVMPPTANDLKERLVGRGTETADVIAQRLAISSRESQFMCGYDYLVVNDDLAKSVEQVHSIISSEHFRTARNEDTIKTIQKDLKKFERR